MNFESRLATLERRCRLQSQVVVALVVTLLLLFLTGAATQQSPRELVLRRLTIQDDFGNAVAVLAASQRTAVGAIATGTWGSVELRSCAKVATGKFACGSDAQLPVAQLSPSVFSLSLKSEPLHPETTLSILGLTTSKVTIPDDSGQKEIAVLGREGIGRGGNLTLSTGGGEMRLNLEAQLFGAFASFYGGNLSVYEKYEDDPRQLETLVRMGKYFLQDNGPHGGYLGLWKHASKESAALGTNSSPTLQLVNANGDVAVEATIDGYGHGRVLAADAYSHRGPVLAPATR